MTGWRVLLRLAWRDVLRNKGRSALILVMIALPVFGVAAAHVVISTSDVSRVEGLDRTLGNADAQLQVNDSGAPVRQSPDTGSGWYGEFGTPGATYDGPATPAEIERVLGRGAEVVPYDRRNAVITSLKRPRAVEVTVADLDNPVFDPMYTLVSGRIAEAPGEVVVNPYLVDKGIRLGDTVEIRDGAKPLEVVGVAEDASYRKPARAWTVPGTLPEGAERSYEGAASYLVDVPGDVSWKDVVALNKLGITVQSRAVILHPPADDAVPGGGDYADNGASADTYTTIALIIAMAVIEVVLLAGPSFAVGARRMQRTLAQVAATGGTPRQVRRAVLATALLLGSIAAALGLLLGIGAAWLVAPVAQRFSSSFFGPFDLVWPQLLGIALLGWLSAVIAAVVPAWIASRQDVVRTLAGRRGDAAPGKASPVLGLVLLVAGLAMTYQGARGIGHADTWVAAGAIGVVLGAVFLLPPVIAVLGRVVDRVPLPMRYAVRDAARHRTRTVPAVGAVLATVAGVVALGVANASDRAESRADYRPMAALGTGVVDWDATYLAPGDREALAKQVLDAVQSVVPSASAVRGFAMQGEGSRWTEIGTVDYAADADDGGTPYLFESHTSLPQWTVGDHRPDYDLALDAAGERQVDAALEARRMVVFTDQPDRTGERDVPVYVTEYVQDGQESKARKVIVPATVVAVDRGTTNGIVPTALARQFHVPVATSTVLLPDQVSRDEEKQIEKALSSVPTDAYVQVERGWQDDRGYLVLILVLGLVGGLLMVAGTLTATFLALSDAAPDLGTLSAVGAAPRERRLVAAAYALVVGGLGAIVGAVVGLAPGLAGAWALTRGFDEEAGVAQHYVDIPWLLILGVVVGLPLLTALVVGLCARSRLPLVARID